MGFWKIFTFHSILLLIFIQISVQNLSENSLEQDYSGFDHYNELDAPEKYNQDKNDKVCHSLKCFNIGKEFERLIYDSVDPCDDFYEYVCGKFSRETKIPADSTSISLAFDAEDDKIQRILRRQLSEPNSKKDPFSVKYATDMYSACIDLKTTESRGVQPLLNILQEMGGWPLINNVIPFDESNYDLFDKILPKLIALGESGIIEVFVNPDLKNVDENFLYIGPSPQIHLLANLLDQIQNRTRRLPIPTSPPVMTEKLKRRQGLKKETLFEIFVKHILKFVELLGGKVDNNAIQQIIDIFIFSDKLSQIQTPGLTLEDQLNKMTIKELEALTSGKINWLQFFNRIYELGGCDIRLTYSTVVIVTDVNYFKNLPDLLAETPKTVQANFIGEALVNDLGVYTTKDFRNLNFQLKKTLFHIEKQEPHWQFCVTEVKSPLGFAVSRKYVEKTFTKKTKDMITQLTLNTKNAFRELIKQNDVLDDESRGRALTKLNAIKDNIGYPDWLFNDKILDSLYNLKQKCNPGLFFECVIHLLQSLEYTMLCSLNKPVDREIANFPFDPTVLNAAYFPLYNSITIPVAMINAMHDERNPRQINYADLGMIIGHELTHGLDNTGNRFDEKGNLNDIFDPQTRLRIEVKQKCFINQYNDYCYLGFCVNGQNTLGENIADNGGMREIYKAYHAENSLRLGVNYDKPMRLPFFNYTTEQIFFISYATLWCQNIRPEFLPVIFNDVHSPGKFRVNGVVSNFKPFADAFNCSPDSKMNRKDKCILW